MTAKQMFIQLVIDKLNLSTYQAILLDKMLYDKKEDDVNEEKSMTYCDYANQKWIDRFDGVCNANYKTEVYFGTFYIINRTQWRVPVYKKLFFGLYIQTGYINEPEQRLVAIDMRRKIHEQTIIDIMMSYGLKPKEDKK